MVFEEHGVSMSPGASNLVGLPKLGCEIYDRHPSVRMLNLVDYGSCLLGSMREEDILVDQPVFSDRGFRILPALP